MLVIITSIVFAWEENGNDICAREGMQLFPGVVEDGSGGGVLYWLDNYSTDPPPLVGNNFEIWAKRIDSNGDTLIYELPYLDPHKFYLLRAVVSYFPKDKENPPIESPVAINIEDSFDTTFTCSLIHPETLDVFLPRNIYRDTKTTLKITGRKAALKSLKLYQFDMVFNTPIIGGPQSVSTKPLNTLLLRATPTIFSQNTAIKYHLPIKTKVSLRIYDASGKVVKILADGYQKSGTYHLEWNGKDKDEENLSKGIYFIQLRTENKSLTRKVVLVR